MLVIAAGLATGLSAAPALAVCSTSLPTNTVSLGPTPTNWTNSLITIPKYDGSSGTLCMVVVRLSASLHAQVQATNTSGAPATLTATMNVNANISAPSPITSFAATPLSSMQTMNVPSGGGATFSAGPINSASNQNFTTPADLASFNGAGFLMFSAAANGSFTLTSSSGNTNVNGVNDASAQIEVTYWVVPEPGSLSLLALGSLAVHYRRRRR
jgi:hypothetical protein